MAYGWGEVKSETLVITEMRVAERERLIEGLTTKDRGKDEPVPEASFRLKTPRKEEVRAGNR